jgi:UDP-2,3-diacylglucosamine pyrophosphatase LpxH
MLDAIIISDLHLGSEVCQAKLLTQFLQKIHSGEILTHELILNGDVFDSWDFRRLKKSHWKVLSALRSLSDHVHVVWINGNHDGPADIVSHLLGVDVTEEYVFQSGSKKILALHGDRFDNFIADHPILTHLADCLYHFLQKIHIYWAQYAKRNSKTFLRCSDQIEKKAKEYAAKKKCDVVCVGHTHMELDSPGVISYFNSGCWTELPCTYLTVKDGSVKICHLNREN